MNTLARAAKTCEGCPLFASATQTVFGEGPSAARLMLIGEQPGDSEDVAGRPFVGPAGKLLDRALTEAGVPRAAAYLTNAVKHFKFEERGKRRIHKRPRTSEITACHPWLQAELAAVKPVAVVCLGAVAAQSFFGPGFQLMQRLGEIVPSPHAPTALATRHPSALLRMSDPEERRAAFAQLVGHLRLAYQRSRR